MKVVVFGGSGLIGSKVVQNLTAMGHEALAASPQSGVNAVTGEGLAQTLAGARVVVDVMNAPSWEDSAVMNFFETTSRNVLDAGAEAGVGHHVALSVVGTDRLQNMGYFRAKLAQERLIQSSGMPYTIVRATQFFEFLGSIADAGTQDGTLRLSPALMQPMAAADVSKAVAEFALAPPLNGIADIAGPEAMGIDEAVRRYLVSRSDPRRVHADANAGYYGGTVAERDLVPSGPARLGTTSLADWLRATAQAVA